MKTYFKILCAAAFMLVSASCGENGPCDTPDPIPPSDKEVAVTMNLVVDDLPSKGVMDENAIKNFNVYCFGPFPFHYYSPHDNNLKIAFRTLPGQYRMYVIANANVDLGEMSESYLKFLTLSYDNAAYNVPMTGYALIDVKPAPSLPESEEEPEDDGFISFTVTRLCAKINYDISVDAAVSSDITITGVQFCNVATKVFPFNKLPPLSTTPIHTDLPNSPLANLSKYSGTKYIFPNCQGTKSITKPEDKTEVNAPDFATYFLISADFSDGSKGVYRIYLGENDTSDFNVKANTSHQLNLVIKGRKEIDNRVAVYDYIYYGTANSYICFGNAQIDVNPYLTNKKSGYHYTNIRADKKYNAQSAKLLWTDNPKLISSYKLVDTGSSQYLEVVTNKGATGNAVINLLTYDYSKEFTCVWSIHIWCPRITPKTNVYTDASNKSHKLMDINLGATMTKFWDAISYGLLYQWGRKDPQLNSHIWDNRQTRCPIFDELGTIISFEQVETDNPLSKRMYYGYYKVPDSKLSISESIAAPLAIITNWEAVLGTDCDLWGNSSDGKTGKSVFDPCPLGYKVPSMSVWDNATLSNWIANGTDYYPASGWQSGTNSPQVGTAWRGWSNERSIVFGFARECTVNSKSFLRHRGSSGNSYSIRCAKEE